ncbi:MAG: hypothetical protein ABEI86_15345, partial [Halobacteriaceae archaeon]
MPTPEEWEAPKPEFHEATKTAIEEKGFTPHPILLREVHHHQPPIVDTESAHKGAVKGLMNKISNVTPLEEMEGLRGLLLDDINVLQDKNPSGLDSGHQPLMILWELVDKSNDEDNESNSEGDNTQKESNCDDNDDKTNSVEESSESPNHSSKRVYRNVDIPDNKDKFPTSKKNITKAFNRVCEEHDS